tara:strand:- start:365 stop:586 length:222 start_codon:yes stop_codon:yes gene_type:complete
VAPATAPRFASDFSNAIASLIDPDVNSVNTLCTELISLYAIPYLANVAVAVFNLAPKLLVSLAPFPVDLLNFF